MTELAHTMHDRIDDLEREMMKHPPAQWSVRHIFTTGLYCREITMAAGSLITSKWHKTEHPYVVSKGRVTVWIPETDERLDIIAPFMGITKPGTRRVLEVIEETVWTTFHPTTLTDVDQIETEIIEPRREHLAGLVQPEKEAACLG